MIENRVLNLVKYFCRQLNFNEFVSAMVIFYEVQNGSRNDIEFKALEKDRPHYRKFMINMDEPLSSKPTKAVKDWQELQKEHIKKFGKPIKIVSRRKDSPIPPVSSVCQHCHAPARYLYINNGKHNSQLMCKICGGFTQTHSKRITPQSKLWCPHCGNALMTWKDRKYFTSFKCQNKKCSHYINNRKKLTKDELDDIDKGKSSQYKLHYQFRIYHFNSAEIQINRPSDNSGVSIAKIHNDLRTFSLILTFYVCFGLSSRTTRDILRHIFDITSVSHQTVINYVNAAAYHLYNFVDKNCPKPKGFISADETYIIVDGKWHYTWFAMDSMTRAICGYNISDTRDMEHALALLYNTIGDPIKNSGEKYQIVTDGNPSYDSAILAYLQKLKENNNLSENVIEKHTVIGLENNDPESAQYRPIKQLVERLNRTYKFHTRPRAGFKSLEGATALTVLFVAFYNFMRPHTTLKGMTPVKLDCLKEAKYYPDMWIKLIQNA